MLLINQTFIFNALAGILEERETGTKISLGGNEVALLQFMIDHPSQPLSKAQLLDEVWFKKGVVVEESSLLHAVSTCRKALNDRGGEIITTIRGVGYQFNGEVTEFNPSHQANVPNHRAPIHSISLQRNNLLYLSAFTLSALVAFFIYGAVVSPWVNADYSEQLFTKCVVPTNEGSDAVVLEDIRAFTTAEQTILIDGQGRSVSYSSNNTEVTCE